MRLTTFELDIIRPFSTQTIAVRWIEVPGATGSFVIGPDHSPIISLFANDSKLVYLEHDNDQPKTCQVFGGVLYVADGRVVALLDR